MSFTVSSLSLSPCLQSLPSSLTHEIYDYLTLAERQRVSGLCQELWRIGKYYNEKLQSLSLEKQNKKNNINNNTINNNSNNNNFFQYYLISWLMNKNAILNCQKLLNTFVALESLDLGSLANNNYLEIISSTNVSLPSLKKLAMVRSNQVTNAGLEMLTRNQMLTSTLEEIDITFCSNTTYRGTFIIRERMKHLKVLRRQPAWMDGHFQTPFGGNNDNDVVEVHTYWPDGSFQFTRQTQSCGFVCELQELNMDDNDDNDIDNDNDDQNNKDNRHRLRLRHRRQHVCDKLQFNDFVTPNGWPIWAREAYRPGVALLQLDDHVVVKKNKNGTTEEEAIRSVLVVQNMRGLRPPRNNRTLLEQVKEWIPLGESRYFSSTGQVVPEEHVAEERVTDDLLLISHMRLIPFDVTIESLLPPEEVVMKNKQLLEENMQIDTHVTQQLEDFLHLQLGGQPELADPTP